MYLANSGVVHLFHPVGTLGSTCMYLANSGVVHLFLFNGLPYLTCMYLANSGVVHRARSKKNDKGPVCTLHFKVSNTGTLIKVEGFFPVSTLQIQVFNTLKAILKSMTTPVSTLHIQVFNTSVIQRSPFLQVTGHVLLDFIPAWRLCRCMALFQVPLPIGSPTARRLSCSGLRRPYSTPHIPDVHCKVRE